MSRGSLWSARPRVLLAGGMFLIAAAGMCRAASGADEGKILFSDDFASLKPEWGAANESKRVEGNRLLVDLNPNLLFHLEHQGDQYQDADIRLTVTMTKGETDQPAGIIFWAEESGNCYAALVSPNGTFYVARKIMGRWLNPVLREERPEIQKGIGETNVLRVVTSGPVVSIYANDKLLDTFRGFPPAGGGGGRFGIHAESGAEPAHWAFSDLSVRSVPPAKSAPPKGEANLLTDDFQNLDPAWGRSGGSLAVDKHKLLLKLPPDGAENVLYRGTLFDRNIDCRVKITPVEGAVDQPAGLVFWASDYNNCYAAQLVPDGGFYVSRRMRGKWISPVSYSVRDEVHKGVGQTNELRVVTSGNRVTIYVNDKKVVAFRGYPPEQGAMVGVRGEAGEGPVSVAFSDLRVQPGPGSPKQSEPANDDPTLILADDFQMFDPAWGLEGESLKAAGNSLQFVNKPDERHRQLYQATLFDDIDYSVNFSEMKGWTDQLVGLIFWATSGTDYFAFVVNPEGPEHYAGRIVDGKWKGMNIFKIADIKVNRGAGQTNQLRVITHGSSAELLVNNRRIGTLNSTPPEGGSRIGLFTETNKDPCHWAFSQMRVRVPLVRPEWAEGRKDGLLLTDDYRDLPHEWAADEFQNVDKHRLILKPKVGGRRVNLYTSKLGDCDARLKISQQSGALDRLGGLIFWAKDTDNFSSVCIRSDGGFLVVDCKAGKFEAKGPIALREELKKGLGAINELQVVTSGDSAVISVNGQQITTIQGSPPKGGSQVGIYAESGGQQRYTWAFSDLVVRKHE